MTNTYSIKDAQTHLPMLVRRAEAGEPATITRNTRAVAYILGTDHLRSLIETMEILGAPAACAAIAETESGRGPVYSLDDIGKRRLRPLSPPKTKR